MSDDKEGMELLIKLVTNFLLVLVFLGVYETASGIYSPNPFIMELFILGIFILSFAFLSYKNPNSRLLKGLTYFLTIVAIIPALNLFVNRYVESINTGRVGEGAIKRVYYRINTLLNSEVLQVTLITFILLFIVIIYHYLKKHKELLHQIIDKIL